MRNIRFRRASRRTPRAALALGAAVLVVLPIGAQSIGRQSLLAQAAAEPASVSAQTPPMGWNSWNSFGCAGLNDKVIKETADKIVSTGMKDSGYEYVVLDDCWFDPQRASDGSLQANTERFPQGMKAIGDYLHARGLKFGIYMAPVQKTCAQIAGTYPGTTSSAGHERQDARTFASWGVDYLKYDWCDKRPAQLDNQIEVFTRMRDALLATGRPIVYSINPNSYQDHKFGRSYDWSKIANLWRTTEDVTPIWNNKDDAYPQGVANAVRLTQPLHRRAGPGHWNDPDMLVIGVKDEDVPGLTPTEGRTMMSMWSMMAAPLMSAHVFGTVSNEDLRTLLNRDMVAIDQDPLGRAAAPLPKSIGEARYYSRPLANGDTAVALYNGGGQAQTMTVTLEELGLGGSRKYRSKNLWSGLTETIAPAPAGRITARLAPHETAVYRIAPDE